MFKFNKVRGSPIIFNKVYGDDGDDGDAVQLTWSLGWWRALPTLAILGRVWVKLVRSLKRKCFMHFWSTHYSFCVEPVGDQTLSRPHVFTFRPYPPPTESPFHFPFSNSIPHFPFQLEVFGIFLNVYGCYSQTYNYRYHYSTSCIIFHILEYYITYHEQMLVYCYYCYYGCHQYYH